MIESPDPFLLLIFPFLYTLPSLFLFVRKYVTTPKNIIFAWKSMQSTCSLEEIHNFLPYFFVVVVEAESTDRWHSWRVTWVFGDFAPLKVGLLPFSIYIFCFWAFALLTIWVFTLLILSFLDLSLYLGFCYDGT